uniref:Uncharacterized protein n=1 Tax=Quercus lobata TaxID=97700 RepID=A0A7N2LUT8_QUELO
MSLTVKKLAMSHLVSLNKNAYIRAYLRGLMVLVVAASPFALAKLGLVIPLIRLVLTTFYVIVLKTTSVNANVYIILEDGAGISHQEFQRWHNGGGTFPKSTCIDPTVLIEMGAIVHPKSVVGAYVHTGSGTVIGPHVTISHLTKIGPGDWIGAHEDNKTGCGSLIRWVTSHSASEYAESCIGPGMNNRLDNRVPLRCLRMRLANPTDNKGKIRYPFGSSMHRMDIDLIRTSGGNRIKTGGCDRLRKVDGDGDTS